MLRHQYWKNGETFYDSIHTTLGNRICHYIGVPMMLLAVVYWTQWPAGNVFPWVSIVLPFYTIWSPRIALALGIVFFVMALFAHYFLNGWIALGIFVFGWAIDLAGHYIIEKNSPHLEHAVVEFLIAPGWVIDRFVYSVTGFKII